MLRTYSMTIYMIDYT